MKFLQEEAMHSLDIIDDVELRHTWPIREKRKRLTTEKQLQDCALMPITDISKYIRNIAYHLGK